MIVKQQRKNNSETHGHSPKGNWSPEYYVWAGMIQRCTNPKRNNYYLYGERGIVVCERWNEFINFLEDMGERPEGTSLDRIDNNGNYCKENCRWATARAQARHRRNNKLTIEEVNQIRGLY